MAKPNPIRTSGRAKHDSGTKEGDFLVLRTPRSQDEGMTLKVEKTDSEKEKQVDKMSMMMALLPTPHLSGRNIVDLERTDDEGRVTKYELQVRRAAIIGDPVPVQTWAEKKLRLIFIYWMSMVLLAAILNATTIFAFHLVPDLYSTTALFNIFLRPPYIKSIPGVILAILITCFYALYILIYADSAKWKCGNFRWFGIVMLNGYILWCVASYIKHSWTISSDIREAMERDFREPNRINLSSTIIRRFTQTYFSCCGMRDYKDWHKLIMLNKTGYPFTCCNAEVYPVCSEPLFHTLKIKNKDQVVIHENGCLHPEITFARAVAGFLMTLTSLFLVTSVAVSIFTNMILSYLPPNLQIEQANPFFD